MKIKKRSAKIISIHDRIPGSMVGGKFERQQVMARNKLPVAEFFCLTRYYYEEMFSSIKLKVEELVKEIDYRNHKNIQCTCNKINDLFIGLEFSEEQKNEILKYYDSHFKKDSFVSVRSSMIGYKNGEGEDSLDNPFAGISRSFLFVKREQIFEKIKLCWASAFGYEAVLYRKNLNLDALNFAAAVGIQEMIYGERSFVLFTCDPKTSSRDPVIVAGYGIGEGIVQEKADVDHYFKNYYTGEIKKNISKKDIKLSFDSKKGYSIHKERISEQYRMAQCLSDEEINKLSLYGERIERIFSHPQDIEGTITAEGKIYFLQSRPISLDYTRQKIWSNTNITESFPGVSTVLSYSFARTFFRSVFYDSYRLTGYSYTILHDNNDNLNKMIGFINGRIYYSLTSFYHLLSISPLFPIFREYWEKMMGLHSSYHSKPIGFIKRLKELLHLIYSIIRSIIIFIILYFTHEQRIKKFHTWWENLISSLRGKNFNENDLLLTANLYQRLFCEVGNNWGITLVNDTYLPMVYGIIEHLFRKWKLDKDNSLLNDLLCGDDGLLSVEIILSAVDLAEMIRSDGELKNIFESESAVNIWKKINKHEFNKTFSEAFNAHLYKYGDRGLQELKMEQPNIRHEPWTLIELIKDYVKTDITVQGFRNKEKETRIFGEKKLKKALQYHPVKRIIISRLLKNVRRFIRNRENARYCRSEFFGLCKNIFRGIGEQFFKSGILQSPDDIVHVTVDEIFGYIDGTGVTEDLRSLVKIRKKEYSMHHKKEAPIQITTLGPVRDNAIHIHADNLKKLKVIYGIGSCPGRVRGRARVIVNPKDHGKITDDMILVAKETDPGWLFLMIASKGLVVERGSMLSHTAITGRKFGIPTIVAVPDATRIIPDGARIEIDCALGIITILD